jgi:hypothetical protein
MPRTPWSHVTTTTEHFQQPQREYGILPFWFLNGELDPDEMRFQLAEFRDKEMPGIVLHGRFGLELEYLGEDYLERIRFAVEEAERLGLTTWIYDEMNWPSGTADGRVLRERPDLAQRYLECLSFPIRGPWFAYFTGGDSRYIDFERSVPVAAFAVREDGHVIDLTPNLSFEDVIPWEVPPGNWRLMYMVEKRADYYIDALDPESTAEFLRVGYRPYADAIREHMPSSMVGFYTDEPAMHYYVTGGENPIVPWTKEMFRRFHERNGYSLRSRLPDLFFDVSPDSRRVRYDFYTTLTAFYTDAYYRQIQEWCHEHNVLFTGHLLYEEFLRKMIRVEGNPFSHYHHIDVIGVDHLYPIIGDRDRPSEHVAMKLASSAAHQLGSDRLLCESFGGIFMDATMQRMKWLTDWEFVLGVNLLNPHGFHYTLEGPRKRDWPPSMFYQYPWRHFYAGFSTYVSRLSQMLTGGRHVDNVAVLWPINDMFATYTPQSHNALADRTEHDFNVLTDLLLRLHHDYDYLDEHMLASASVDGAKITIGNESYQVVILPPMRHLKLSTIERLEQFVAGGGRVLGTVFLPDTGLGEEQLVDISERVRRLFDVDPAETQRSFVSQSSITTTVTDHPGGGKTGFLQSYALNRQLPWRLQESTGVPGQPESAHIIIEDVSGQATYWFDPSQGERQDVTSELAAEREEVMQALGEAIEALIAPDITIDNREVFYLHRVKDDRDIYFFVNPTYQPQIGQVVLSKELRPVLWDPSDGEERPIAPWTVEAGSTSFEIQLPPAGSAFVLAGDPTPVRIGETDTVVTSITWDRVRGYLTGEQGSVVLDNGRQHRQRVGSGIVPETVSLDGEWAFQAEDDNALIINRWLASERPLDSMTALDITSTVGWLPMVPGAWAYQLPSEPVDPYPVDVWYRLSFEAAYLPPVLELVIDGFAGSGWEVYFNGNLVEAEAQRSKIDSQMQRLDLTPLVQMGGNVITVRLTVTRATDGLLDLVKITGDFAIEQTGEYVHRIVPPRTTMQPTSWTEQGYPFYSGRGVYRSTFTVPAEAEGKRIILSPAVIDDVLEILVNGSRAGIRLWAPYDVDITEFVKPGENVLELRVANTLINLLEAVPRASGLSGAPQIAMYEQFDLEFSFLFATAD